MAIWIGGFGVGMIYYEKERSNSVSLSQKDQSSDQKNVISLLESEKNYEVFKIIAERNLLCCGLLIGGGFLFSIPTIFNLCYYGFVLGFQISDVWNIPDKAIREESIIRLMPHSFEVIGIWIAGALSFYILLMMKNYLSLGNFNRSVKVEIAILLLIIDFAIIILAAYVESYVSPYLII